VQDRDGAAELLREARRSFPFLKRLIGDASWQGPKTAGARTGSRTLEIIRSRDRHRFVRVPKGWIVASTLVDQPMPCPTRDYERCACYAAAFVRLAMIRLMLMSPQALQLRVSSEQL
jgi:hypothetical protein